jgi:hypothetical protein
MALEESGRVDTPQDQMYHLASLENTKDTIEKSLTTRCADSHRQSRSLWQCRSLEMRKTARDEHGFSEQNAETMGTQKSSQ